MTASQRCEEEGDNWIGRSQNFNECADNMIHEGRTDARAPSLTDHHPFSTIFHTVGPPAIIFRDDSIRFYGSISVGGMIINIICCCCLGEKKTGSWANQETLFGQQMGSRAITDFMECLTGKGNISWTFVIRCDNTKSPEGTSEVSPKQIWRTRGQVVFFGFRAAREEFGRH